MAIFTCSGKDYKVPEMNFLAVERAWPFVQKATEEFDPMKGTSAAISVIAAAMIEGEGFDRSDWDIADGLDEDQTFDILCKTIKRRLKMTEIGNAKKTMFEILEEGGLQVTEGELLNALETLASQDPGLLGIAADTLPSSLPQE